MRITRIANTDESTDKDAVRNRMTIQTAYRKCLAGVLFCLALGQGARADEGPLNGTDVKIMPGNRVELHVADVPLATVLRMLSTQGRKNIVASPKVTGTVTANLFDVTFEEALGSILLANNAGFLVKGNFIHVYTIEELAEIQASMDNTGLTARLFRLNYISAADISPMIEPILSEDGKVASTPDATIGLATSAEDAGGNELSGFDAIMVYDYPDRLEQIDKIIREVDVRPKQVLVEATILRAQLGEDNALGIDFTTVGGVDFEMLGSISPGVTDIATGIVPQAELNNTNMTLRTDFNDAVPKGGVTFGIIKDQMSIFLRALEQVTDTTVLANPKILALNKQRGEVIVGRRDGFLTTTVTETTAVQTVDFLETGTQLVFRPFIGDDDYVRMEIHPEDSTGGLNEANLPFERTTEVTTNIMVRDGHTILIGGLFRESTQATRGQVPILGNIPGAGALFRNTADETGREEVIILLTVRIIRTDNYEKEAEQVAEDIERVRVGSREGIQAYGRERLSMAHYRWALQHLQQDRLDKALWDVRMTLHLNPTFLPALKIKEEIVGRPEGESDIGIIRDFIRARLLVPDDPPITKIPPVDEEP
jgi:type IV pilus assembly protein PilQ